MPGPRYPSADPEWTAAIQREWRAFTPSAIARGMAQADVPEAVRLYALKDRAERLFALSATQTGREQLATLRGHSKMMREIRMLSRQLGIGSVAARGKRRSEAADALVPPIGTRLDEFCNRPQPWHGAEHDRWWATYKAKWDPVRALEEQIHQDRGIPLEDAYREAWLTVYPNGYQGPAV